MNEYHGRQCKERLDWLEHEIIKASSDEGDVNRHHELEEAGLHHTCVTRAVHMKSHCTAHEIVLHGTT